MTEPWEVRFWSHVNKSGECWLWTTGKSEHRYGLFQINGRKHRAHRLSWVLANGPIPDGLLVCHNCPGGDNPACVNPAHLFLGTVRDNFEDAVAKGIVVRVPEIFAPKIGASNRATKLTEADVIEIRASYVPGVVGYGQLAQRFGVGPTTIRHILERTTWTWL